MSKTRRVHYVLSTHWDREWLLPFQGFRHRLVRLMDRVLGDLDCGKLKGPFTTDGQSIVIPDYLEVRPECREQVERLAREGKLKVGPWFVLPDEWLVSGESLVRNLRLGREVARGLGGAPSNAGFVCDLFGHIGQLPQLFAGFGIRGAFVWRGIEPRPHAHFIWEGSDGTRLPTFRFGRAGYCDYTYDVRRSTQPEVAFDEKRSVADHRTFIAKEAARTAIPPVLVYDGGDHLEYDEEHYRVLLALKPGASFPFTIVHGTLDDYLDEMLASAGSIRDVVSGELSENAMLPMAQDMQWLIPGVLSSRVGLKQANAECQTLLCQWAEPFGALAKHCAAGEDPAGFLSVAWQALLTNHPHDSIGGCSRDQVHEDMRYRFAQCQQIGERMTSVSLRAVAASAAGEIGPRETRVLVANPLTRPLDEAVDLTLQIPVEWQSFQEFFGYEPKPAFRIYDREGNELAYQRVAQDMGRTRVNANLLTNIKFPQPLKTNDVTVCLRLAIPALGYTTLSVREGNLAPGDEIIPAAALPTRYPDTPGLATSERSMENEFLAVTVEDNGTLSLTDKRSGQTYTRLLTFEDAADIGDGWYHGQAANDQVFVSTASRSDVARVHNGPLSAAFKVVTLMRLPAEFRFDRMVRSEDTAELRIESLVQLRRGADRLEIRTRVQNTVKDHRLRVLFPTGAKAATYLSDGAFDVVERPIALRADNHLSRELAVETRPQQSWSAVSDAKRGLAIVSQGLHECSVRDLPEKPIALTLLRATRRTIFTDGEPGGQVQGDLSFSYWIVPFAGPADRIRLFELSVRLAAGLRDIQMTAADLLPYRGKPVLPASASFLHVTGGVVVTSLRDIAGTIEVRFFNPDLKAADAVLDFTGRGSGARLPSTVQRVDLESQPLGAVEPVVAGRVKARVRPKEILTLRFTEPPAKP